MQVGPRLELEVVKVEEGLCDGKVLFHSYVKKSAGQASEQQSEKELERVVKEKRRKQQVQSLVINVPMAWPNPSIVIKAAGAVPHCIPSCLLQTCRPNKAE